MSSSTDEDETITGAPDIWKLFVFGKYKIDFPMQLIRDAMAPQISVASGVVGLGIAVLVSQLVSDAVMLVKVALLLAIFLAAVSVILSKGSVAYFAQGLGFLGMKEQQTASPKRYPIGAEMKKDKHVSLAIRFQKIGQRLAYGSALLAILALSAAVLGDFI